MPPASRRPVSSCRALAASVLCLAAAHLCHAQQAGGGRIRQQDVFTSTNVLTPGETDEWPLAARDNETFIVLVESENFDPAVELVSPEGAVVAQNDDVRPGEQDSLMLARAGAGGAYKVRVKASKSAAGGQYELAVEAKAGQILRFESASETFDTALQLFNPRGESVAGDDDGGENRNAKLTALVVEPGRHLLRVYAHGNGGAGSYLLRRAPDAVRQLAAGGRVDGAVGRGGSEIWSFAGRAGQTVILSARSPDFDTRVTVYGPDAAEIAADDNGGEGTDSLLSVRLPLDGAYTVWVSAQSGGGRYSLRLIDVQ
ncbi:MAG TPA: PPC domain-containing protein [Pyrinomonadaceae bacterium]|nr:PPC domain-containing protein [Pyrinomonadaceae bacterium]